MYRLIIWIILSNAVYFAQSSEMSDQDIPKNLNRIISLAPSLTESIYLLNMGEYLVGNTVYCNKPDDAKNKQRVATAVDVNIESVVRLKPDLVVATPLTDFRAIKKIKLLKIKVVTFDQPSTFNQMTRQFLDLGQRLGQQQLATTIINRARKKLEKITKRFKNVKKPKVFVQLGARPLFAATSDSFVNDLITYAQGINIAEKEKNGIYSREMVLSQNPDIILITSMGMTGEEEQKNWLGYRSLKAAQTKQVHIIDSELFCSPSVESYIDALIELIALLHPQLNWKLKP